MLSPAPEFAGVNNENSSGKGVRFLIPCLRETLASTQQIFVTTDPSPLVRKLGPVHRWKRTQLDWLDADYSPDVFYDFIFESMTLPQELRQRNKLA